MAYNEPLIIAGTDIDVSYGLAGSGITISSVPSGGSGLVRFSIRNVNFKATGATLIGTVASDVDFYPMMCRIIGESVSGLTLAAGFQIGTNASTYNNILASNTTSGIASSNIFINFQLGSGISLPATIPIITSGTGIYVNVTSAATGTACIMGVEIFGDYM